MSADPGGHRSPTTAVSAPPLWRSPTVLAGAALVVIARLGALPRGPTEWDELLFVRGVESFEPLHHRPHPPGYPLLVGLGKLAAAIVGDPFGGLVWLSVVASLVGFAALVAAYAPLCAGRDAARATHRWAVAGALLFALSPSMLVHGAMALSDAAALAFAGLTLAAAVAAPSVTGAALGGAAAAAAVGCRPQLAVALAPTLLVMLLLAASSARRAGAARRMALSLAGAGVAAFALVAAAWMGPLVAASGGPGGLLRLLRGQAGLVAGHDASLARAGTSTPELLARFLLDPWGPRWAAWLVLALAAAGGARLLRRRPAAALPLLVFGAADLAFALAVMNPDDGARYALPSMVTVAGLAAVGGAAVEPRSWRARAVWLVPVASVVAFAVYTAPLLRQRATADSPPVRAAAWGRRHLPARALVLYDRQLESFALQLLPDWKRIPADGPLPCNWRGSTFLLAEGRSGVAGGPTFHWPRGSAWRRLTRGRYGVVSWTPIPAGRLFEARTGVYGPEPSALAVLAGGQLGDGWRWLADEASIRVCPGGATALELALRLPPEAPDEAVAVAVELGGVPQATVHLRRGERRDLRLALAPGRRVRLDLHADRSFVPDRAAVTSGDRRRLAVQLVRWQLVQPR
jgi:hypothetical protein